MVCRIYAQCKMQNKSVAFHKALSTGCVKFASRYDRQVEYWLEQCHESKDILPLDKFHS